MLKFIGADTGTDKKNHYKIVIELYFVTDYDNKSVLLDRSRFKGLNFLLLDTEEKKLVIIERDIFFDILENILFAKDSPNQIFSNIHVEKRSKFYNDDFANMFIRREGNHNFVCLDTLKVYNNFIYVWNSYFYKFFDRYYCCNITYAYTAVGVVDTDRLCLRISEVSVEDDNKAVYLEYNVKTGEYIEKLDSSQFEFKDLHNLTCDDDFILGKIRGSDNIFKDELVSYIGKFRFLKLCMLIE